MYLNVFELHRKPAQKNTNTYATSLAVALFLHCHAKHKGPQAPRVNRGLLFWQFLGQKVDSLKQGVLPVLATVMYCVCHCISTGWRPLL